MSTLHIFNVGTDHVHSTDHDQRDLVVRSLQRNIWQVNSGDMLILPFKIADEFLNYFFEIKQIQASSVEIYVLGNLLTDEILSSLEEKPYKARLFDRLKLMDNVNACYLSPWVRQLAHRTPPIEGSGPGISMPRTELDLNTKSGFRSLATRLDLPIPYGVTTNRLETLAEFISSNISSTDMIIVKPDSGAGAEENALFSLNGKQTEPGTSKGYHLLNTSTTNIENQLKFSGVKNGCTYVSEVYYPWNYCFYFEFIINKTGSTEFSHSGDVFLRMPDDDHCTTPIWKGLEFPSSLEASKFGLAKEISSHVAQAAADEGARGVINIDGIIDRNGRLLFNETNVRWGGGTGAFAILKQLKRKRVFARTIRGLTVASLTDFKEISIKLGLEFSLTEGKGILAHAVGKYKDGELEVLVLASSKSELRKLSELTNRTFRE